MFVTATNFDHLPYNIPDAVEKPNEFPLAVNRYETEILSEWMLGLDLYDEFKAGLLLDPIDPKWLKLRDGAPYTFEDPIKIYRWRGLNMTLTPYVFSKWTRENFDSNTKNGVTVQKVENSQVISPNRRIVTAHNSFYDFQGNHRLLFNTFYGFMKQNYIELYPSWVFKDIKRMNVFNL